MDDLVPDGAVRVIHRLCELLLGQRHDILLPDLAVFGEVIVIEMSKGICIHFISIFLATG
jgi:hypothetical protein